MRTLLLILLSLSLVFAQPKEPPKGTRCVVCGMDVNIDPRLTSQVKLKDGMYKYAESPKHILEYYLENKDKVAELWVKDYESGKWIDGTKAYYVVIKEGPMGYDLAPFQSKITAQKFAKRGKIYQLRDITKDFLQHLEMGHIR
ncbi:nitrous oxide reductase accessory protein NosL [Hydrogenobacter hydrogenophilus]|uniref:Nitrous oxide reductase accessory protein NosL n=1 Tax=Hydrogenobacter hydrogenophilus TaxID=35835 RepID=A0A285NN52_9AQUI|nr:nitrous oxide reductase accessory protein NosL [Hydrogenobacter hydrogenophilus]SNZ10879.1 Nitrous oxide reductase accessory protein NosL [Hydrogenobacter hydrogenophilus]